LTSGGDRYVGQLLRVMLCILSATVLGACGGATTGSTASSSSPTASRPSQSKTSATPTGLAAATASAALLQGLTGSYTFTANAKAQAGFDAAPGIAGFFVRSINKNGVYVGVVGIKYFGRQVTSQELRDGIAGAEHAGQSRGTTKRTTVADVQAVETTAAKGKAWELLGGQYLVIVAATTAPADDTARQLAARVRVRRSMKGREEMPHCEAVAGHSPGVCSMSRNRRSGMQLKEDLAAASTVPHEDDVGRGDDHKPRHHASTVGALSERR